MSAAEFKKIFLPLSRRMYWTAWQFTGNAQEAEDLVQEAFLKLWQKRDLLGDIKNTEAYCTILIKNLFINQIRHKRIPITAQSSDELAIDAMNESDIEEIMERKEESFQVKCLIEQLPEQQRRIITLHDMEELSNEEIQQHTGLQPNNIRVILSRARKTIRDKLIMGNR